MNQLMLPCPACNGDGFTSCGDRHARTRKDACGTCGGRGQVRAGTGETPGASADPAGRKLYAAGGGLRNTRQV